MFINSVIANYYTLLICKFNKSRNSVHKKASDYVDEEIIVSLTTYPKRMKKLPLVLESVFRQTVRPSRVILWLAEDQFEDKDRIIDSYKGYINMGLEIRFCDDLKSHKKYYYSITENPDSIVITLDDDILYPEDLIEKLLLCYSENPDCIVAQRAHLMTYDNSKILKSYSEWKMLAPGEKGPSLDLFATTGGGCLFPPHILPDETFDKDAIEKLCMYADDVWIKCMSYYKGVKVVLTDINNPEIIEVMSFKSEGLAKQNVVNNQNDQQLKAVSNYFGIKWTPELY